jgi:Patatin-like phospholipase
MPKVFEFHEIFEKEIVEINSRRDKFKRDKVKLEKENVDRYGNPVLRPTKSSALAGLSLSGGGIRSASFCLGVLQALNTLDLLKKVDYLSTVSGGGYIGTSMCAAMSSAKTNEFPFASELAADEPVGLQHIRDYSNYLFPRGATVFGNLVRNLVVYMRGVVFSFILTLPFLLFFAMITIALNRDADGLETPSLIGISQLQLGIFGNWEIPLFSNFKHFAIAFDTLVIFLGFLALWGVCRSANINQKFGEIGRPGAVIASILLLLVLVAVFTDAQKYILIEIIQWQRDGILVPKWIGRVTAFFAAFSAAVGFLASYAAQILKNGLEDPRLRARILRFATQAAIYLAAAALPFLLWVAYLHLALWGLCVKSCGPGVGYFAPAFVMSIGDFIAKYSGFILLPPSPSPLQIYVVVTTVLAVLLLIYGPNANTLHRLYRDRLSKAFIFDPSKVAPINRLDLINLTGVREANVGDNERRPQDLKALDRLKLSEIDCQYPPYQLINTALNIGGSKYANRRGRNADFFMFSPKYTGSRATRYVKTTDLEENSGDLDIATAMAVSGAAASSNMGANTIRALTPTLTLLNVRLGFWLTNPTALVKSRVGASFASLFEVFYFIKELLGLLREDDGRVYLTDGGHIENLGIYELLHRRCRLVIAVDAEADEKMNFTSLMALERHALIDLGVRIDLPWAAIRDVTRKAANEVADSGGMSTTAAPHGPHCAIGEIEYPDKQKGFLLYIKSSLTGDENDGIIDHKRRFPEFPHETTADQFFSEEQFEVYRALGFHAAMRGLNGEDLVAVRPKPQLFKRGKNASINEVLDILN